MKDELIQIGGKSYKQCEVVMLPTEKATTGMIVKSSNKTFEIITNKNFDDKCQEVLNKSSKNPQHLYILSDEEIKEGDWYYSVASNKVFKTIEVKIDRIYFNRQECSEPVNCKKIIATTDILLTDYVKVEGGFGSYNKVPRTSDDFIKAFVKAQGKIDKVLVEYEYKGREYVDEQDGIGYDKVVLKVAPDNTITIKPIQEEKPSWSRDEIENLLLNYHVSLFYPNPDPEGSDHEKNKVKIKQYMKENL